MSDQNVDDQQSNPTPAEGDQSSADKNSIEDSSESAVSVSSDVVKLDSEPDASMQATRVGSEPNSNEADLSLNRSTASLSFAVPEEGCAESSSEMGSELQVTVSLKAGCELTEDEVKELLLQLSDDSPGPAAPTETYTHPVTGREVYVPKQKEFGPGAAIATMALLMFVGGGLATLMMVARAFDLHGDVLVSFVIGSCAVILGMAGGLLLKTLGDKFWIGAIIGACFGVVGGILIYLQTSHHTWWH